MDDTGNIDENVMKFIPKDLKSTPEFQKQIEDFKRQLEEEREFMISISDAIFKLKNASKHYNDFEKQEKAGKEFIATKVKEKTPYAEARKQWLQTLVPFKQNLEEIALSEARERERYLLRQKETELSTLEAEEKTITETEALIEKQTGKEGQDIGEN